MTNMLRQLGVQQGKLLDLTVGWNFNRAEDRQKVTKLIQDREPDMVIGRAGEGDTQVHIRFMQELYQSQMKRGFWFVHEQAANMTRGVAKVIRELGGYDQVETMTLQKGRKQVRVVTNSQEMRKPASRRSIRERENEFNEVIARGLKAET